MEESTDLPCRSNLVEISVAVEWLCFDQEDPRKEFE